MVLSRGGHEPCFGTGSGTDPSTPSAAVCHRLLLFVTTSNPIVLRSNKLSSVGPFYIRMYAACHLLYCTCRVELRVLTGEECSDVNRYCVDGCCGDRVFKTRAQIRQVHQCPGNFSGMMNCI
jgi:hypothetical protein